MKAFCWAVLSIAAIAPCFANVTITDVQIWPEQPSVFDEIAVVFLGIRSGSVWFDKSVFSVQELSGQLDLYFTGGDVSLPPRTLIHTEEIGTLPEGHYDLFVQSYWRSSQTTNYILTDDFTTHFDVVPEPATIVLFCLGGLLIRKRYV